ncbi:MAG: JAB domain-containing protein [Candidatus Schekmanbacteria bacterium]|nr:JAB domain-containing protein [Candidatus Schekmanbacteria bacterium]
MKLKILEVREASGEIVASPRAVANVMAEEGRADREYLWVLHLNRGNRIIEKELISIGTLTRTVAEPREIFKKAIIQDTSSIITVHNHPGGQTKPSFEDKELWKRLDEAGELIGIDVIDNIIITPSGNYFSTKENQL